MSPYKHPPLKRHPSLQPLSRDHYGGLVQADRLCKAAAADVEASVRRGAVADFLDAWHREIAEHFEDEERLFRDLMNEPETAKLHEQHQALRTLAEQAHDHRRQVDPGADWCRTLGEALRDHIRWEERELFPAIQARATPEQLETLARHTAPIEQRRGRSTGDRLGQGSP